MPVFVPLRPFWAVVSYAGSLMGYIALQLALDFSPAVLGLLFALLAPFPDRKTRLGAAWDRFLDRRFPKKTAPDRARPVCVATGRRQDSGRRGAGGNGRRRGGGGPANAFGGYG